MKVLIISANVHLQFSSIVQANVLSFILLPLDVHEDKNQYLN